MSTPPSELLEVFLGETTAKGAVMLVPVEAFTPDTNWRDEDGSIRWVVSGVTIYDRDFEWYLFEQIDGVLGALDAMLDRRAASIAIPGSIVSLQVTPGKAAEKCELVAACPARSGHLGFRRAAPVHIPRTVRATVACLRGAFARFPQTNREVWASRTARLDALDRRVDQHFPGRPRG